MLFLNIFTAVAVRLTGASLPRESDKLVVMWKFRWLPLLNLAGFVAGSIIGFLMCLAQVGIHNQQGNACMDGTQTYLGWYVEWLTDTYAKGAGVVHPLGESIINPWAQKATELNISKPPDPDYWIKIQSANTYFGRTFFHDSFFAYAEFMAEHLGHHGTACYGPSGGLYDPGLIVGIGGFATTFILVSFIFYRNPQFYWLRPDGGKRKLLTCGWWSGAGGEGDPYDMSRVYEEFCVRAQIGQDLAAKESKEKSEKGYVDPHVGSKYILYGKELGLKWMEIGSSKPAEGTEISNLALAKALEDNVREHKIDFDRAQVDFTRAQFREFNVSDLSSASYIKVATSVGGSYPGTHSYFKPAGKHREFTVLGEGGDIINTARAEEAMLLCVEIKEIRDTTNRKLLQMANLDARKLLAFLDDTSLLNSVLFDAGIDTPGDRLEIIMTLKTMKMTPPTMTMSQAAPYYPPQEIAHTVVLSPRNTFLETDDAAMKNAPGMTPRYPVQSFVPPTAQYVFPTLMSAPTIGSPIIMGRQAPLHASNPSSIIINASGSGFGSIDDPVQLEECTQQEDSIQNSTLRQRELSLPSNFESE